MSSVKSCVLHFTRSWCGRLPDVRHYFSGDCSVNIETQSVSDLQQVYLNIRKLFSIPNSGRIVQCNQILFTNTWFQQIDQVWIRHIKDIGGLLCCQLLMDLPKRHSISGISNLYHLEHAF